MFLFIAFENVVLNNYNSKSFFQLDCQVDINFYPHGG